MKIAIVGSWQERDREKWSLSDGARFAGACRRFGVSVAKGGHQLIVGGSSAGTADYHAVEGIIRAKAAKQKGQLVILRPADGKVPYADLRRSHGKLFTSESTTSQEWAIAKLMQAHLADAVAIVGGAENSYLAGVAAAVAGKRVVPIGSFGGAGKRLITLFQESAGKWRSNVPAGELLGSLHNPWSDSVLDEGLGLLGVGRKPKILIVHGRSMDRTALKMFLQRELKLPGVTVLVDELTPGEFIGQKFERLAKEVDGAIALVTPDDVGGLAHAITVEPRARQNVWIEVGWFWGALGLKNVLMLAKGEVEIPSDLAGVEHYGYRKAIQEKAKEIRAFVDRLRP